MSDQAQTSALALPFLKHALIAVFGAVTHALVAQREGKTKSIMDFIILVIISSFTGVIFSMIAMHCFPEQSYLSMAIGGTGGYIGVEGMSIVIKYISKKFK